MVVLENLDNNSEANAEAAKTRQTEKEANFSELYLNLLESEQLTLLKWKTSHQRSVPTLQSVKIHLVHWVSLTKLKFFLLRLENLLPF